MGSGLFLASGIVIHRSGPAALWMFLIGGIAMSLEIVALGEMSAADPTPGSFLVYAERVWGPALTFITGWVFWVSSVLTMSSEVTAAALFTRLWWPNIPVWIWAVSYSAGIVAANFVSVRGFGEIEGMMSGVKVTAVGFFLVFAAIYLLGGLSGHGSSDPWKHLISTPWWVHGWQAPASSLILVLFAFAGTGVIGIAAGETQNPPRTIRRALEASIPLLLVFYLGSVLTIMMMVPWSHVTTTSSPFVQALQSTGLDWASQIMNVVLIFAVLSTMNAALYSNSRVLYTLGHKKQAPASLAQLNPKGIPANGIIWSATLLALTIVLAYLLPQKAYAYLVTATGFQAMFIWLVVLLTHLRYRPYLLKQKGPLHLKLPGYPWTTYIAIGLVGFGMIASPLAVSERIGLIMAVGFIGLIALGYWLWHRRNNV